MLNFADLQHLIELTAERARAAQESVDTLVRILEGQRELIVVLKDLAACTRRVEGVSTAVAAYLANRNGADLERLQQVLTAIDSDGGECYGVSVHVEQQAGGTKVGRDVRAESDRDVNVSGGNIERE